jgi:hypothetical protein
MKDSALVDAKALSIQVQGLIGNRGGPALRYFRSTPQEKDSRRHGWRR